jgi:DNA-binding LytR/AlgR family response regulator
MTQSAPEPEKTEEAPGRSVLVAGEQLSVGRLRYIEARQHLVDIRLDGRSVTHRARLSDIIAQTDLNDGMQPHRSWWVSANSEPRLIRDGARYMLKLADDTTIPVARGRVAEVQAWLDAGHSDRESAN